MRVAVLSLCRDRLWATKHCFQTLRDLAGCDFDHYVLDQGSQDGTVEWLLQGDYDVSAAGRNLGVSRGMNALLDHVVPRGYDVIVKFDNDCELLVWNTLKACAEVALEGYIASPHIQGLNSPPVVEQEVIVTDKNGRSSRIGIPNIMGGIFMAAPAVWYTTYRHDETNPIWGMDDAKIVDHWRAYGGECGYLLDYPANHFLSTAGQEAADPVYWARKVREFHA